MSNENTYQFVRTVRSVCKPFPVLKENGIPVSLEQAQTHAGKLGHVFANHDLVEARTNVFNYFRDKEKTLKHPLWKDWSTILTEEDQVEENILVFHGGYVFKNPDRITRAIKEGLIEGAGKLTEEEINILKEAMKKGVIPDTQIPVIPYGDFSKLSQFQILQQLPRNYGVFLTLKEATNLESGAHSLKQLENSPLFIVRAGGVDRTTEYLYVLNELGAETYGNRHNFQENGGRLLYSDDYFGYGFDGYGHLDNDARFLGVSPAEGGVEKITLIRPDLSDIIKLSEQLTEGLKLLV